MASTPPVDYRVLVDLVFDGAFVTDASGRCVEVNARACAMLGCSREELLARSLADLVQAEDLLTAPLPRDGRCVQGVVHGRVRLRHVDGGWVECELRSSLLPDQGVLSIARDISERAREESAHRERGQLLLAIGANLPLLVWVRDFATGALLYTNPEWKRLLGRAPELGAHFSQLFSVIHPSDIERVRAVVDLEPVEGVRDEVRFVLPNGEWRLYLIRTFAIPGPDGAPQRVVGLGEDVTQRRAAEEALRLSEEKYRNFFENAPVGLYRTRLDGSAILDVNRRFCELFGRTREELLGQSGASWWADPRDREVVVRLLLEKGQLTDYECKMAIRPGETMYALASGTLYRDLGYLEGAVVDITARKNVEEALRHSQQQLAIVFDATSELLALLRVEEPDRCYFEATNRAYLEHTKSLCGVAPALGDDHGAFLRKLAMRDDLVDRELLMCREAVVTGRAVRYEVDVPGRDGPVSYDVHIVPVLDAAERVIHLLWSGRDVSARKRADEQIRAALCEKEVLLREVHHRVKNNLQIVSSLLYLATARQGVSALGSILRDTQARVASMALIHDQLYRSTDLSRVAFQAYAFELARSLHHTYSATPEQVAVVADAEGVELGLDVAVPCGLILTELVTNALKHAFPSGRRGTIRVSLTRDPTRVRGYELRVSDDGIGLPAGLEHPRGGALGMQLVARLVQQMNGQLSVRATAAGTEYQIQFDDSDAAVTPAEPP